ncbi:unnamed protein product [Paramecium primaurelia]|uniref:Uncharacterized protein n=1 Tax=Paramecium primaurelia TaxID=5886 RepID=A0A8S1KF06_PARPR|nr:unnamed protein product [Paramecium primaurelia]
MLLVISLLLLHNVYSNFVTCPQLYTSRQTCESQKGCIFYDWKQSTCYYDCPSYPQQECILLFNCKWVNQECQFKACLDYSEQGPKTCSNTPGCNWYWNKCRQQDCQNIGASTQAACSKTYCVWDEIETKCINKACADYKKSICQQLTQCTWSSETCTDAVFSNYGQFLMTLLIILLLD